MNLLIIFTVVFGLATAEKDRFDNYRVHRVIVENENQADNLRKLQLSNEYNFWSDVGSSRNFVDIMVPPHKRNDFQNFIKFNELKETLQIENVQSLIDDNDRMERDGLRTMDWTNYHTLEEIYKWLDDLTLAYPNVVKVVKGGKTYEGREIKGIEIHNGENLTGVFLESGIHSREWIGPAATSWMVNEMLKPNSDPLFKKFNYVYFPSTNPDGYVYTWKTNRLWRKTRTPYKWCFGADPNRNFDFHWNDVGSSTDPCSEVYGGPSAFSEVETKSLADYVKSVYKEKNLDIFLCYHSFSQLVLYPWGYTTQPAPNYKIFDKVGQAAAKAIEDVHGEKFKVGSISTTIYPTSGTSLEWYYATTNATVDIVYELRDTGKYGFLLPPKYIIPSGEEVLASLKAVLLEYQKLK